MGRRRSEVVIWVVGMGATQPVRKRAKLVRYRRRGFGKSTSVFPDQKRGVRGSSMVAKGLLCEGDVTGHKAMGMAPLRGHLLPPLCKWVGEAVFRPDAPLVFDDCCKAGFRRQHAFHDETERSAGEPRKRFRIRDARAKRTGSASLLCTSNVAPASPCIYEVQSDVPGYSHSSADRIRPGKGLTRHIVH